MIVDHIGIIVESLDKAVGLFQRLFGMTPSHVKEMKDVGIRIAYFAAQNVNIELIEYISQQQSFGRKVMGSSLGLNHIAFDVKGFPLTLKRYEKAGLIIQEGFPRMGGKGEIAFFEKNSCEGILVEIVNTALDERSDYGKEREQEALERKNRDTLQGAD